MNSTVTKPLAGIVRVSELLPVGSTIVSDDAIETVLWAVAVSIQMILSPAAKSLYVELMETLDTFFDKV